MVTSSLQSYRTNQLNNQLRAHADLIFLQVNNELAIKHFEQIKESTTQDKNQLLKKLTISSASYRNCPIYNETLEVCKNNPVVIEIKKINSINSLTIGLQPIISNREFEIDDKSGFKIDKDSKLIEFILVIKYKDRNSASSQSKEIIFTQTFQPI